MVKVSVIIPVYNVEDYLNRRGFSWLKFQLLFQFIMLKII